MRRKTEARCETFLDANLRALVRLLVGRMSDEECHRGAWRFARLELACHINTRSLKTLQGSLAPGRFSPPSAPPSSAGVPVLSPASFARSPPKGVHEVDDVHGCRSFGLAA